MTTATTKIINATPSTITRASKLWDAKNDAGEGFAPDFDGSLDDELADLLEGSDKVVIVEERVRVASAVSVHTLAVAWSNGLWAVDITGEI